MEGLERLRARTFSDYFPRPHQEIEQVYGSLHHNLQPYSTSDGVNFVANNSYIQYSTLPPSYSSYSPDFPPTSSASHQPILYSYSGPNAMPYSVQPPPRSATLPTQHRIHARNYASSNGPSRHPVSQIYLRPGLDYADMMDTEEQDSFNKETGCSEPIEPPLDGYPDVNEFDVLMKHYVAQLSPKKQDKALINAQRAANIRYVLSNKKTTAIESAQFRFWVKKMFSLEPNVVSISPEKRKICHEKKPIAVREKLFKILTRAHQKCQHGGRDKTSAQVRKVYSWVPKELISRFVKLCPTCRERRGATSTDVGTSPPVTTVSVEKTSSVLPRSPSKCFGSGTMESSPTNEASRMPSQLMNSSSTFQSQNRWIDGFPAARSAYDNSYQLLPAISNKHQLQHLMSTSHSTRAVSQNTKNTQQTLTPALDDAPRKQKEAQLTSR